MQETSYQSMDVRRGEFVGIIGPNGAGKTTFFHAISGVHVPTSGKVRIDGRELQGKGSDAFCRADGAHLPDVDRQQA
jgi:branched-chain amino acid transport system ATP-binding protein